MYSRFSHRDGGGEMRYISIKFLGLLIFASWKPPTHTHTHTPYSPLYDTLGERKSRDRIIEF